MNGPSRLHLDRVGSTKTVGLWSKQRQKEGSNEHVACKYGHVTWSTSVFEEAIVVRGEENTWAQSLWRGSWMYKLGWRRVDAFATDRSTSNPPKNVIGVEKAGSVPWPLNHEPTTKTLTIDINLSWAKLPTEGNGRSIHIVTQQKPAIIYDRRCGGAWS